jgi:branched-chain amino acid transport system permease protein
MKKLLAILLGAGLLFGLNRVLGAFLNPYILQIIVLIGINLVMATSLNLIIGYAGQFNLGHAGFMAIGAYAAAAFSVYAGPPLGAALGFLPGGMVQAVIFLLALALGGLAAAVSGLLIGIPTLRLRGDYLAIATLGFGEIVQVVINNMDAVGGARGFGDIPEYSNFFWVFLFAALTLWVVGRMTRASKGMAFLAIREDEIASLSLGISNTRTKVTAFVVGSFFAGLGGGLFAHFFTYLHVNSFSFLKSIEYVVMVVLGGMGNLWGVAAAAVLLTILPEALRAFAEWRMVIYSLLIIVTMLIRSKKISFKKRSGKALHGVSGS